MPLLMLKDIPQYDCFLEAAKHYPSLEPSANEAFLHLLRTADLMSEDAQLFYNRHAISQGRFTVMMLLHSPLTKSRGLSDEHQTPASLAEQAGVTRATMTGLLDTLEKDSLICREPNAHDRRITHIRLTEEGRVRIEAMIPDCFQCISRIISPLTKPERKELVRLLQKLQEGLTRLASEAPNPA
ncbi:MAG: MarR family transcriptional regulator [Chthoniobacteraceae bacterium]|nr:MarR family transcriptional regulator [Chthoniobacteraceae bacterium]